MVSERENLAKKIIYWYLDNGRTNLPWRRTKNPYKVLITELMLQKTHAVQQVLPVYVEFFKNYPNMETLSKANVRDIRLVIESLGLQNIRSRRLKELASFVCKRFDGKIPRRKDDLMSLPGVGEYISNAVLCIAFNEPAPMVDANFGRVLGRVFYGKEEYPPSRNRTWKIANDLLPATGFKEFNLGVIDLGALVCRPKSPHHKICPISEECKFFKSLERGERPQEQEPLK
jgi:A/G-specific adenine glycosylase